MILEKRNRMEKVSRTMCLLLAAVEIALLASCAHKPAYSEMDTNKSSRNQNHNQNQNAEAQANASTAAADQTSPANAAGPAPAPASAPFKPPSFLDQAKGQIKDLPSYPNANRVSLQIAPIEGVNTMSIGFTSSDSMDKIAAFFERVIKDNKWTVSDKIIDPEFSEWTLKKGNDENAKVQVKKDQRTGAMNIAIVRGEKLDAAIK
jgi:hypothetical protein